MNHYPYPKSYRLLTPTQYKRVFDYSSYKVHQTHIMAFVAQSDNAEPRLGMAITKKKLATAVSRNLVKRLIKEQFRFYAPKLKHVDMVFILKKSTKHLSNADISKEINAILKKISERQNISDKN